MPDVHVPKLDEHEDEHEGADAALVPDAPLAAVRRPRGRSILKLALEVALIGTGVFLGLARCTTRSCRDSTARSVTPRRTERQ